MKNLTDIFLKARSGIYKDTSENRRLHRVGQKYGESKQPEDDEKDKKKGDEDFEEAIEKFSEMFYDGESSEKLKRYLDSRLGEGTYDRISKETSSRQFEESSERKDYFMGKVEDAFLNKKAQSVNPDKELEAVNKVIEAINNKKMTLPSDQIMVLIEKKNKFELAKKQAEKINAGVKANEEKRNVKEVKETNKKINEASKRKKKYGDMNVEEAKKEKQVSSLKEDLDHQNNELDNLEEKEELDEDGELVTITHDKDKFKRYRLYRDLRSARMKRGTSPELAELGYLKNSGDINKKGIEKYFELQKEFGDKKYDFKEKSGEEPKEETKESFTRVKFDDLPNSGKVNLKKYLSDKVKRTADENLGILSKVSTENLKKMEAGLVKEFNSQFDDLPKSRRAEKLYSIMKVKAELAQRGNKG